MAHAGGAVFEAFGKASATIKDIFNLFNLDNTQRSIFMNSGTDIKGKMIQAGEQLRYYWVRSAAYNRNHFTDNRHKVALFLQYKSINDDCFSVIYKTKQYIEKYGEPNIKWKSNE